MSFDKINLIRPIQKALAEEGYKNPTPIQKRAIPIILDKKDLLGCAQTGTGKTAAFALPILQHLYNEKSSVPKRRVIRALIVTPTRELAIQIGDSFKTYGKHTGLKNVVVFGGVKQKLQTDRLLEGVDILVATPGRLLDLMEQNYIILNHIKLFVLDEADRMLDMGFINDVKKIISKLPAKRQSLFFSATMPPEIIKLARTILVKPAKVEITPEQPTVEAIRQSVYHVSKPDKKNLLIHLLKDPSIESALVFTRTKHGANNVARILNRAKIHADAIHGNKSQNARQKALNNFKLKETRVLVATDIAARGIDIDELSHVINYDIPNIPETYVHRIGRTGRAGLGGAAISLCDGEERAYLKDINKMISKTIPIVEDHPYISAEPVFDKPKQSVKKTVSKKTKLKRYGSSAKSKPKRKNYGSRNVWTNRD
ncbi:MAG: DEAD/DEAH box helicase [Ignavibacteriae bacterium]|nr:DEAD/DEAH box helicase [Ignavibacteriota bacterium]NOG98691.1 DEAD/DEAH box helicase [Ignavibacteriota bacterium]